MPKIDTKSIGPTNAAAHCGGMIGLKGWLHLQKTRKKD
jgi:hypothetical protein